MAESNPTQVILTDDGLKIINAQKTADNAASGVLNLNDPYYMSVIEKQNNIGQFAGLTSQYNVLVQNAKDDGIDTIAVTTAYNNLNRFMADILADPNHASYIDRVIYKKYQDAYNEELAKLQNALQNNTNDKFTSAASALSQAASTANVAKSAADSTYAYANSEIAVQSTATAKAQSAADGAFSQAQVVGSQADSAIAVQSTATAKAQSAADNAFAKAESTASAFGPVSKKADSAFANAMSAQNDASSAVAKAESTASEFGKVSQKADSAFDNALSAQNDASNAVAQASSAATDSKDAKQIAGAVSQSYKTLTDGSTMTIAELQSGLAVKLTKKDLDGYATENWTQTQIKATADGLSGTISSVKNTVDSHTTSINDLKADSSSFKSQFTTVNNTLGKQTTDIGTLQASSKELTSGFNTLTSDNKTNKNDISQLKQTATEVSSTLETVQTQVQNSAVGTNLLTGSSGDLKTKQLTNMYNSGSQATNGDYKIKLVKGQTYTYRAWIDNTNGPTHAYVNARFLATTEYSLGNGTPVDKGEAGYSTLMIKPTEDGYVHLVPVAYSSPETTLIGWKEEKLEKGSLATDWCPNPADNATKSQITQLSGQIDQKVDSGDFSTYKTQTTNLIAEKVANKDFATYQKQTADLISSKVATKDFTSYKDQTAKSIDSMVKSKDFETYKTQTAGMIDSKVSNSNYTSDMKQMAGQIEDKVSNGTFTSYKTETANLIGSRVSNGDFTTYKKQTADLISSKVETKDFSSYKDETAKAISSKVESKDFNTYKEQTAGMISSKVSNGDFSTYKTQTTSDINLRVTKDDLLSQINIQAGKTLISSGGQLTLSGKNILLDSNDPVIMKSANIDKLLIGKKLTAADISANTFTTNNGTFTVKQDGSVTAKNMTLIGGTLTSPTINTSTINGSTINGTTFNAGARLNSYGNTSHPLTINPDGSLTSTSFKSIATENAALRTFIKDGTVKTSLRGMTPFSPGMYSAADVSLGAGQLALLEGYSNSQDPNFTASNLKTTGYAILDASTGLSLHGTTQSINFSGTDKDQSTGITMNSYGNIYGQSNSTWWRIGDVNGNQIVNFGIDKAGSNYTEFKRNIQIGNIGINTAHSITMQDGKGLYINSGRGGRADLNVASLNYQGSVSKSLLSEKRDVKKVNTAYWAQLVNSIDLATYQYKDDDNTSNLRLSGIVDDVNTNKQWQLPDVFVARDEDGKLAGIENIVLQNAMLATIQEQQKEIDKLNGHLLELEAKLNG